MPVLILTSVSKTNPRVLKLPVIKKSPTRRNGESLDFLPLIRQRVLKLQFYNFV
ncbi:hypothetical protein HMPREF9554_00056 [Treponema phagedenis F0421]|nr:hypothetical protein HMPREF9554_00056 [Treponema phagedenis F0421]